MHKLSVELLSANELEELRAFLASDAFADDASRFSGLEELQGYLAAVICGPEMIMPSEWIAFALGEVTYENDEQAGRIMTLLLRFYNEVAQALGNRDSVAAWFPVREIEASRPPSTANLWCRGFIRGIALRQRDWSALDNDDELSRCLLPIIALGGTRLEGTLKNLGSAHATELIQALPQAVTTLYARMRRNSTSNAPRSELPPLPHYENAELASCSVPELLALMVKDEDRVPRNVLDELVQRGAETTRALRARLESNEFWSREVSDGEWWLRLHAIMILGLMPDAEAGETMIAAMRRMSREKDEDLQDWLAAYWSALFRNKPVSLSDSLRALSEDRTLYWYMRTNAAEAVAALAERAGAAALDEALAWLVRLVADESEDWEMRLCSANTLLDCPRATYRLLLEALADRQKKPDIHFTREEIEEAYAAGEDQPEWRRFEDPWQFYTPAEIAARQKRWAEEAEDDKRDEYDRDDFEDDELTTYVRQEPKVGRNDLCPCGSGKKYKKCHGAPGAGPTLH